MYYQDENGLIYDGWLKYKLGIASPTGGKYYGLFDGKCKFTQRDADERLRQEAVYRRKEIEEILNDWKKRTSRIDE